LKKVLIFGAGDLGIQYKHMIDIYTDDLVIGWLDDTKKRGDSISGIEVIGDSSVFLQLKERIHVAIAIGYNHLNFKMNLINSLKTNPLISFYTFIHPTTFIDKTACIEDGVFIYPNSTIDMGVTIKMGSIVNNSVTISHNSIIGESSFIAPGVVIAGNVIIGNQCFIGAGTIIKDSITINDKNIIGSGCNIYKNIDEKGARFITKSTLVKL
jgi:sugar O-acyltransferase (sialic acid O-acetyltransferase NeuD family)